MEHLVYRKRYLDTLNLFRDQDLIKVVTGLRRSGKSTLLDLYKTVLIHDGVSQDLIHTYDFEKPENYKDKDWYQLYSEIQDATSDSEKHYLFIDVPQNIPEFERLIDGLFTNKRLDLYITGSNATMLSSDLATLLSGRYVEVSILPFSFDEYLSALTIDRSNKAQLYVLFDLFIEHSALPLGVFLGEISETSQIDYIQSVYDTVVEKDIVRRYGVRNKRAFENVIKYVVAHIGSELSPSNIAAALKADKQMVDNKTIENYLSYLTSAFLLYKADRFDIKGKRQLATKEKYYLVDAGFRAILLGKQKLQDRGHTLENVVYLELLRRGNQVWVGKSGEKEIDFVAKDAHGEISYYQVAWTVENPETARREIRALESIKDHYPKYLITHDIGDFSHNGIKQIHIVDWILSDTHTHTQTL
jgi:predicted AAA+ superfamily ATPase